MKKVLAILVSIVVIMTVCAVAVTATDDGITLTGVDVLNAGAQSEFTVALNGCPDASSVSVSITVGENLEIVSDSCGWVADQTTGASLVNFDKDKNKGALAFTAAKSFNGDLFKLTVKGKTPSATKQDITVAVTGKNKKEVPFDKTITKQITVTCGNNHDYGSLIPQVDAKCGVAGKKAHYKCSVCGKFFTEGKVETTETALAIPALSHAESEKWSSDGTYHWKTCTREGCGQVIESTKAAHSFEWKIDKNATEDETGIKHEECVCGLKRSEGTVIGKLDHVHTGIVHHNAVAATCKTTGTVEYWTCSSPKCAGKYYSDAACQNEIASIIAPKNPDNHTGSTYLKDKKDATCYATGYTGDVYCSDCDKKLSDGTVINKTAHKEATEWSKDENYHWHVCTNEGCGQVVESTKAAHDFKWVVDAVATVEETGLKHEECLCGAKRSEGTVIEKLDHTHSIEHCDGKAATCKEEGSLEFWICTNPKCAGKLFADKDCMIEIDAQDLVLPIDPKNHETEIKNKKAATCTEDGYTGDVYCADCGELLEKGTVIKAAHNYVDGKCTACGGKDPNYQEKSPKTSESSVIAIYLSVLAVAFVFGTSAVLYKKKVK